MCGTNADVSIGEEAKLLLRSHVISSIVTRFATSSMFFYLRFCVGRVHGMCSIVTLHTK